MANSNLHPTTRAALWMVGALFSFVAMAIAGRELSTSLTTFQILFFRSVCGLLVIAALLCRFGWQQLTTQRFGSHMLRNVAHFGGQFGWFYGLAFIPLAQVFAIEFTVPVWVTIFAIVILKERLTVARVTAVVFGLAGVLVIVKPGSGMVHPAALAVFFGAIAYAFAYTLNKKLSATETPLCILFYMTAIQLPIGFVLSLPDWTTPALATWPFIFMVGTSALTAHYCITRAMTLADATIVMPMDFLRLPLIALIGAAFYGEHVQMTLFVGAALILTGNLFSLYMERKRSRISKSGVAVTESTINKST